MRFAIQATFTGAPIGGLSPEISIDDIDRDLGGIEGLSMDSTEPGDSEYGYLAEEGSPSADWFAQMHDTTVSGVLDRAGFYDFVDATGCYAEDCLTLGTLGGPACPWGIAPDINMVMESQHVIASIRVTPLPERGVLTEANWERVRAAFLRIFGVNGDPYRDFRRD